LLGEAGVVADLFVAGLATELAAQLANGVADLVRLLADLARTPVLATQLVENGAADAQRGELAELTVRLTVAPQAVEQAHQADLLHVLAVEHLVGLQRRLANDALDQWQVLHQPALLEGRRDAVVVYGAGGTHGRARLLHEKL